MHGVDVQIVDRFKLQCVDDNTVKDLDYNPNAHELKLIKRNTKYVRTTV